jgi:hypothetical protein
MSATATAQQRPAWMNKPAWDITKIRIRRMAGEQGHDPDALALHYFDTELDNLLEWQADQIDREFAQVEREQIAARELASGQAGFCFECGVKLRGTSSQCGACKEGIGPTPATFDHSITIHRHRR